MDAQEQHDTDMPGSDVRPLTQRLRELFETPLPVSDDEQADLVRRSGNPDLPRRRRALTNTEIGVRVGYSAKYVEQVRSGYRDNPRREFLEGVARLYGKPVEWLSSPSPDHGAAPQESGQSESASPMHPLTRKLRVLFATPMPVSDARLAELRLRSGNPDLPRASEPLKDTEIARAIGKTPTYVGQLKSGRRTNPSLDVLQAIADLYRKPIGDLVTPEADYDASTMAQRVKALFLGVDDDGAQSLRFTPEHVAAEIGADPAQLQGLCDGTLSANDVPIGLPAKLSEYFGVSLRYLLGGIGDPAWTAEDPAAAQWPQSLDRNGTLAGALRVLGEMEDPASRERVETTAAKIIRNVMEMETEAAASYRLLPPSSPPPSGS